MTRIDIRRSAHPILRTACSLALLAGTLTGPAVAAKVYRCGNVFQDQPCPEVRIAVAAPVERTLAVGRDSPCPTRDTSGRTGCLTKPAAQPVVAVDLKR